MESLWSRAKATTLTIETEPHDIVGMRARLAEYALPVPSRNADVLYKFTSTTLISNAEWDGVFYRFTVKRRPTLPGAPAEPADRDDHNEGPKPADWPGPPGVRGNARHAARPTTR